jgi:ubiquinone/menaquinone biosynthesis C-methylase UbiE
MYTLKHSKEELERIQKQAERLYDGADYLKSYSFKGKVLDLGCGTGYFSSWIAKTFPDSTVIGMDLNSDVIHSNTEKNLINNLSFAQGDVNQLPFEDDTFDFIHCRFLFLHISTVDQALSEIKRVLKKGGKFIAHEGCNQSVFTGKPKPAFSFILDAWIQHMMDQGQKSTGITLSSSMKDVGYTNVKMSILNHLYESDDDLYKLNLINWLGIFTSVKNLLKDVVSEEVFERAKLELSEFPKNDIYFELTAVVEGSK